MNILYNVACRQSLIITDLHLNLPQQNLHFFNHKSLFAIIPYSLTFMLLTSEALIYSKVVIFKGSTWKFTNL